MSHTPPKVTIDLAEYEELKKIEHNFKNPEGGLSKQEEEEILGTMMRAIPNDSLPDMLSWLERTYKIRIKQGENGMGQRIAVIVKLK